VGTGGMGRVLRKVGEEGLIYCGADILRKIWRRFRSQRV